MRCACIDVGSNTTRLLVADADGELLVPVRAERVFTLLGRTLAGSDVLPPEKLDEAAAVVAQQARRARELGAERVRAVATAAIRGAANARALVDAVEDAAGLRLEVLDAREEARLTFRGAARVAGGGEGLLAVVDVGGGSTEIAFGSATGEASSAASLPVGSALLAERHLRSDPPAAAELDAARLELGEALARVELRRPDRAVAVGGSAASVARFAGSELGPGELQRALALVRDTPAQELAERFELALERARLVPAGLLILAGVSARLGRPLRTCRSGLREGVIAELVGRPGQP